MFFIRSLLNGFSTLYTNLIAEPDWRSYIDILILAFFIYELILMMLRTRASSVFKGIGILLVFTWLSDILQLNAVSWTIQQFINTGVLVLVVLFQPEIRKALEQIGRSAIINSSGSVRASAAVSSDIVNEIITAISNMSRKRIGALIVLEQKTGLREFTETGTQLNADISSQLIENIFEPNTPLHDGAMIIINKHIASAACILQLSQDYTISKELGTRHRAAIGITESTDAISLVVSEETGNISIARAGKLTRYVDTTALTDILNEAFGFTSEAKPGRHHLLKGRQT